MSHHDVVVIGAGIAGASLAAEIAGSASVLIAEAEDQPGYHATGRSAAFWEESYGGAVVQPLTTASGPALEAGGFLSARGSLHIADAGGRAALADHLAAVTAMGVAVRTLDRAALDARLPGLRAGWDVGLEEASTRDIDVAALHAHYLASARRQGAVLRCAAPLRAAERRDGRWRLHLGDEPVTGDLLVNAAGAWADPVAALAGARPLAIRPLRRTVAQLRLAEPAPADLPLVFDARSRFYVKPVVGGRLWLSPHDETPVPPGDIAPEEIDVARAIAVMEEAFDWQVTRVERSWAGLRSFAPDRAPVYGFDPIVPGFFWCAGQGGFGIQTAPAAARLAAALLLGGAPDAMVAGIDPARFDPARPALA
ncbi:NAD(P)/FAD-dependent oxidoreductase [Sphingomonas quercus]|uniref:FAD-binding oxidoreductase n=1 Tax=Sphingomonas quercus TaxID=2842451 RepID=A0ABS6BL38_9SPHN|nr:FAD-dependent oxidoreductase [Sphingomonas quercus]MBU3079033.1 FAD-binding oxidoreductase [Sphingomonas quercus]